MSSDPPERRPAGFRVRLSGREPISHPLAPVLVDLARRLHGRRLTPGRTGAIALRAGRTMLTTAPETDFEALGMEGLVEVADYDPVERILVAIGPREPDETAALLWLVLRHRDEVGAALLVPDPFEERPARTGLHPDSGLGAAEAPASDDPLDAAKVFLRAMRRTPVVRCPGIGLLATGSSVPDMERNLMLALAGAAPDRFGGDAWAAPADTAPTKKRNGGSVRR